MLDLLLLELDQYSAFLLFIFVTIVYLCYQNLILNDGLDWTWVGLCSGFLVVVLVGLESDTIDLFRPDMIVEWYDYQPGKVALRNYNTYLYSIGNSVTDAWLKEHGVTSNKKLFLSTSGLHQFTDYYQFYSLYPLRKDPLTPTTDRIYYFISVTIKKIVDFFTIHMYSYFWGYSRYEYIGSRSVELFKYKYRISRGDFFLWRDFVRFDYSGTFIPPYDRYGNKLPGTIHNPKYWISWEPRKNSAWSRLIQLEDALTHDIFRERYFQETRGGLFPEKVYKRLRKHLKLPYKRYTRRADWVLPLSYEFYYKGFLGADKGRLITLSPFVPSQISWIPYLLECVSLWLDPFSFKAVYYSRLGSVSLTWAEGGLRDEFCDLFLKSETDRGYAAMFARNNQFRDYMVDYYRLITPIPDWIRLSYQKVPIRQGFVDLILKGWNQRWLKLKYLYVPEPLRVKLVFFFTDRKTMDGFFLPVKNYVRNLHKNIHFLGLFELGFNSLGNRFLLQNTHSFVIDASQNFDLFSATYKYHRYYDDWINTRDYRYLYIPIRKDFYDAGVFQLYPYLPKLGYVGYRVANLHPDPSIVYQPYSTYPTRNIYLKKIFKLLTFNDEAKYYIKLARDFLELNTFVLGELGDETFFPELFTGMLKGWVYIVIGHYLMKRVAGLFTHNQYDYEYLSFFFAKNPFTLFANFLVFLCAANFLLPLFSGGGLGGD